MKYCLSIIKALCSIGSNCTVTASIIGWRCLLQSIQLYKILQLKPLSLAEDVCYSPYHWLKLYSYILSHWLKMFATVPIPLDKILQLHPLSLAEDVCYSPYHWIKFYSYSFFYWLKMFATVPTISPVATVEDIVQLWSATNEIAS